MKDEQYTQCNMSTSKSDIETHTFNVQDLQAKVRIKYILYKHLSSLFKAISIFVLFLCLTLMNSEKTRNLKYTHNIPNQKKKIFTKLFASHTHTLILLVGSNYSQLFFPLKKKNPYNLEISKLLKQRFALHYLH